MSFIIQRYGVTLRRLRVTDIALVRRWRNDTEVNQYMEYREHITADMQLKWFHTIDNDQNLFYIIEYKGKKIGLISTFAIDWNKRQAECGIFVWTKTYWQGVVPVFAVLAMLDINFLVLGLEKFTVKIHDNNFRAKVYNKSLGYELVENQEGKMFKHYYLTKESYLLKSKKMRKIAAKLNKIDSKIIVKQSPKTNFFVEKILSVNERIMNENFIFLEIC